MRKPRAGRSDWLLLVLLALAAVVVWIFTTSQPVDNSATALANPLGEGNAATNQESTNGAATTEASTERAISTLASRVKVVGQVACPDWATPPGEIVIDLRPQAGTEAEARRIRVYADRLHFEFANIKAGNWELEARADGFQSFKALYTFTPGQRRISLLVPMVPANLLRGRVSNHRGLPAAHCAVSALRVVEDTSRAVLPLIGRCDENGEFSIEGVRIGNYLVHPGPPRAPLADPIEIQLAGSEAWVELSIPATGQAKITTFDFKTSEPVAKLVVTARHWQPRTDPTWIEAPRNAHLETARTDEFGVAQFFHLPPGEYSFTAQGHGYRQRVVRRAVITDKITELEIRVRAL